MTTDDFIDSVARRVARIVAEELRGGDPSLVEQANSPLGSRRHIDAVKRRMAAGQPGASHVGRRYLLSQEALGEELGRASGRRMALAKTDGKTVQQRAKDEMLARLRAVRQ